MGVLNSLGLGAPMCTRKFHMRSQLNCTSRNVFLKICRLYKKIQWYPISGAFTLPKSKNAKPMDALTFLDPKGYAKKTNILLETLAFTNVDKISIHTVATVRLKSNPI